MKTRTGFVSNSSSSSFILITTEENWLRAKENLHPYCLAVAAALMEGPFDGLGQRLVKFSTWESHGGGWSEYLDVDYEGEYPEFRYAVAGEPNHDEAFEMLQKELSKGDCIHHSQETG